MKSFAASLFLATLATVRPAAAQTTGPAPLPMDLDPARLMADRLATLSRELIEPGPIQDTRDAAAHRLLSIGTNEARSAVGAALRDPGNNPARLAAARAVADDLPGDPEFVDSLFVLLDADVPKPIVDSAIVALGNFKLEPDVSRRLVEMTKDNHPEVQRLAAIRAMALQVEKRAAEQLVALTGDPSPVIDAAATDAVRTFASLPSGSPADWWKTQADHDEDRFRAEIFNARVTRAESQNRRGEETYQELRRSVLAAIANAPRDGRGDVLLKYLASPREAVRLIAVTQAYEFATTGDLPPSTRPALRLLLADTEADIRYIAARTLAVTNDADGFESIARQLAVESDPRVRAELARAMGPIGNIDAVPLLRGLLDDSSTPVVLAVADALARLAPAVVQRSATDAADLAIRLQATLQTRTLASDPVRASLLQALVPLRQRTMLPAFRTMLTATPPEAEAIRRLAAAGLGAIGEPATAGLLVEAMRDDSAAVRMEAVRALGSVSRTFENAEAIYRAMVRESDPAVAEVQWSTLKSLLPLAPREQLARWPDLPQIQHNDSRLLDVFAVLEQKSATAQAWDDDSHFIQELGDTLMRMGRYPEATTEFKSGLAIARGKGGSSMRVQTMIVNTVKSLLLARDYNGAAKFASDELGGTGGEGLQGTIGPEFKLEAERLVEANQLDDAMNLISAALGMTPALAGNYRGHLLEVQQSVKRRQGERNEYGIPEYLQTLAMR